LKRDPKNRCNDIADARIDIQKALDDPGGVLVQQEVMADPRRKLTRNLLWIAAVFCIIILGVAIWKLNLPNPVNSCVTDMTCPKARNSVPAPFSLFLPMANILLHA
jgi:hypothetical protein